MIDLSFYNQLRQEQLRKPNGEEANLVLGILGGAGQAILMSNAILKARGDEPLFCSPDTENLEPDLLASILTIEQKSTTYQGDTPFIGVLLIGLTKTFPCSK